MSNLGELDLVAKWVEINKKLEAGWAPLRELAGERDAIEKTLPFLKNKGVSPYPPKPVPPEKTSSSSSTILIESPPPAKKPRVEEKKTPGPSEKDLKKKMKSLQEKGKTEDRSKSDMGLNEDQSQSFQGNK